MALWESRIRKKKMFVKEKKLRERFKEIFTYHTQWDSRKVIAFQEDFVRVYYIRIIFASSPHVIFLFPCLISDEQKHTNMIWI